MTKITQIDDRGAVVAWSPTDSHADVIAVGSKDSGSTSFDTYGGELELYDLNITSSKQSPGEKLKPTPIGSIKTQSRFSSIGWTKGSSSIYDKFTMGLLAGGMDNGMIQIWNPCAFNNNDDDDDDTSTSSSLLSTVSRESSGSISALSFNPHVASAHLLATGSSNGEILITSLDNPDQPTVTVPTQGSTNGNGNTAEITQMAWNTEVAHIVASSAGNGITTIWDLKQNKPWCELRCEIGGGAVSDVAWNPNQGMHLLTASSDDRNPVLKLWDLRASMSMPLATLEGHTQGILSMDWCPHDDTLVLSCGKDNRTILWDVFSLKAICDLPNDEPAQSSSSTADQPSSSAALYGSTSGLSSSQQKRYDVQWSPLRRGVVSTCSFDRKVQAHSVIGPATKCGRPPKWMKPASGVTFGTGGNLLSFSSTHKVVELKSVVEEPTFRKLSQEFELSIASGDFIDVCLSKAESAVKEGNMYDSQIWGFMQVIFEENARQQVLYYLGFDPEKIHKIAMEFNPDNVSSDIGSLSLQDGETSKGTNGPMSAEAEEAVNRSLLVGNFEAAVECCFRSGNMADALVLASCGGAELWAKAQAQYFASEVSKRPYLSIVSAVIHNKLRDFVTSSDPKKWQETLAVLCTYATAGDEFLSLCEALGDHLEDSGDLANASLCYMCAINLEKASKYWLIQLDMANKANGGEDFIALHTFAEKVIVLMNALDTGAEISENVSPLLFRYAKALADQGLFSTAAKYCRSNSQECKELRDLLYRSKYSQSCLAAFGSAPEFPYQFVNIGIGKAATPQVTNTASTSHASVNPSASATTVAATTVATTSMNGTTTRSNGHGSYNTANNSNSSTSYQKDSYNTKPSNTTDELSQGWIALQDPSSGRYYYANQTTGETTWEKPSPPPAIASVPAPTPSATTGPTTTSASQPQMNGGTPNRAQQPVANGTTTVRTPGKAVASKYGDGFVTSASHPELAEQYGNVGTSNPYTGSSRPGIAVVNEIEKPPVSGTFNPNIQVSTEYKPLVDKLMQTVTNLSSTQLSGSEKRQLAEVEKGAAIFSKRLARNDIDGDVAEKVGYIINAIETKDFANASGIQTSLVNSDWKEHKDWLKGMKFLIQMTSKRR